MSKVEPHQALKTVAPGKLIFDERDVVHRVDLQGGMFYIVASVLTTNRQRTARETTGHEPFELAPSVSPSNW